VPTWEQGERFGEVDVGAHSGVADDVGRGEDVGADVVGVVVVLEERAPVGEGYGVVVDVDHPIVGVDALRDLVGVLGDGQAVSAVEELLDTALGRAEPHGPRQEVVVGERERVDVGDGGGEIPQDSSIDRVVVLAAQRGVVDPGDACPRRVDLDRPRCRFLD
jgi:hypothetical protein